MENILEVRNLSKQYDQFALENVSFTIPRGSIMGLIGENGAGKTTIIKALLNQIHYSKGEVIVLGKDMLRCDKEIKQEIGVAFDEVYFDDTLNVKAVAKILSKAYRNFDRGVFDALIKRFKLPVEKNIKGFSKGMKMKLSLAAALSHHPKLLILDEATSGLDPIIRGELLEVLLDFIQDEEHGILLSSHITGDLEKICDYVTFIHEGRVVFSQNKDTLLYDYRIAKGSRQQIDGLTRSAVLGIRQHGFGCEALVNTKELPSSSLEGLTLDKASLEEIMMLVIKGEQIC